MTSTLTILLIDDDVDDQESFLLAANAAFGTVQCLVANHGLEAIGILSGNPTAAPHCVFMEWRLPMIDIATCILNLRQIPATSQCPIFILSGSQPPFGAEALAAMGIMGVIRKPASASILAQNLRRAICQCLPASYYGFGPVEGFGATVPN